MTPGVASGYGEHDDKQLQFYRSVAGNKEHIQWCQPLVIRVLYTQLPIPKTSSEIKNWLFGVQKEAN
ncbi:hypothetical protein FQN55_001048 [Onygenales sp. PD_40]|nr:hypothetical protein FQN55_001048 [Onygenales sp. PD_40]